MKKVNKITNSLIKFRNERDWKQFHTPKDMALSLTLEVSELLEHFQWKNEAEIEKYLLTNKDDVGEELADVLYWVLIMGNDFHIDVFNALEKKIQKNILKYPVKKSKGNSVKYNKL